MNAGAFSPFSPAADALSVAIVQLLWQGLLIGLLAAGTLTAMSRRSAEARYRVACLALGAMFVAFAATFSVALAQAISSTATGTGAASPIGPESAGAPGPLSAPHWWPPVFGGPTLRIGGSSRGLDGPWLAAAWLTGAAALTLSSLYQAGAVRRLIARADFDLRDRWRGVFESVSCDLRLDRLQLGHSAAVDVPTVVGWLAPVVLVPLSPWAALSCEEMRAILMHELAHIRRHDYLANALQKVVESVLFFHPVTWWLSRRIREEREYCCDDLVVQKTDNALVYARALSQLETLRTHARSYPLGADGGSLMNRITRIVGARPARNRASIIGGAISALVLAMLGIAFVIGTGGVAFADGGSPTPGGDGNQMTPGATAPAPSGIVAAADAALDGLVANGTIDRTQADALKQMVAAGHIELSANSGLTDAQMQAVADAIGQVKRASGTAGAAGKPVCAIVGEKLAHAVQDGKMTQAQADQQLADCSADASGSTKPTTASPTP